MAKKTKRPTMDELRKLDVSPERRVTALILEKFECPDCGALHSTSYDAGSCCEPEVDKVFVCAHCYKQSFDEAEHFYDESDVKKHIEKEHGNGLPSVEDVRDLYTELYARHGVPPHPLGEWAFQMERTCEFLIPPDVQRANA